MSKTEITNAKIKSTTMENKDRGILTIWFHLEYDGGGQGYGGYALDEYIKDTDNNDRVGTRYGTQCIINILDTFDVRDWDALSGIYCRVEREAGWNGDIIRIGHVVEDRWFSFKDTFVAMEADGLS